MVLFLNILRIHVIDLYKLKFKTQKWKFRVRRHLCFSGDYLMTLQSNRSVEPHSLKRDGRYNILTH